MSRFRTHWLAVAVIAMLGGGLLHNVFAHHARCAEHGEWVDADDAHAPLPQGQQQGAVRAFTHEATARSSHAHCAIALSQQRPTVASRPSVALRNIPPSALPPKRPPPQTASPSVPPIKVAPKQSPPLA